MENYIKEQDVNDQTSFCYKRSIQELGSKYSKIKNSIKETHKFRPIKKKYDNNLIHIKSGKVALMCLNCYSIYRIDVEFNHNTKMSCNSDEEIYIRLLNPIATIGYCKYCKEYYPRCVELDYNIAEAISIFNKKGYITKFCCEGHNDGSDGYIYFENSNILEFIDYLPDTWYLDLEHIKNPSGKESEIIIRTNYFNFTEAIEDITQFANNLPLSEL